MTTVLVVDDDPLIRRILAETLRREDFDVIIADSGTAALAQVERHRPQLMVLDVLMPDIDGFEVARRLRDEGATLGIVFLTALAGEAALRGLALGDDYLTKPFGLGELTARVRAVLRRTGRSGSADPSAEPPAGAPR